MGLSPAAFTTFADMLRRDVGLVIGPEKIGLLEVRLSPVLQQHKIADLNTLAAMIGNIANKDIMRDVVEAMTTHESSFFRDSKPFTHLVTQLPRLYRGVERGARLRIWSAAASTGQEAYSIAMTLTENATGDPAAIILATDISRPVLARATEGKYSALEVQRGLTPDRLSRHFEPVEMSWKVKPSLKTMVTFKQWNILHDPSSLGVFDVIFCRNVLIYFDQTQRRQVLAALATRLRPDGLLYLGSTETILEPVAGLAPVPGEAAVWKRIV